MTTSISGAPFTRREISVDGIETSYLEAGTGEPLLLLHGGEFGGEAEVCWERTIPELSRHFRVIAPDLLGFGQTAKVVDFVDGRMRRIRHLARFVDMVGAVGAPCVGNSMGGMLALFDAGCDAPLLKPRTIVSIAGGGALSNNEHTQALFDYDGSADAMVRVVQALFHDPRWAADPAYVERRRRTSLAPGAWEAIAAARFQRPEEFRLPRESIGISYGRIAPRTLIVAGENDKIKPANWWDELTTKMPDATAAVIAAAGHCAQIEKPERVNQMLVDFLKQ